jgi:hypothetical protein
MPKRKARSITPFMSELAEKSLPFFKTLKGCIAKGDFEWTPEAENVFQRIKEYMASLPALTAPAEEEHLFLYLSAGNEANNTVLIANKARRETPVYFVSRALKEAEINYPPLEKSVLKLVHASRRLQKFRHTRSQW